MVDCTGLENRQRATVREFESHRFLQVNRFHAPLASNDGKLPHLIPQNLKYGLLSRPFSILKANPLEALAIAQLQHSVGLQALTEFPVIDL